MTSCQYRSFTAFPWRDVVAMGSKVLVMTDNQPEKGLACAEAIGQRLFALRGQTVKAVLSIADTMAAIDAAGKFPLVLADTSDIPLGGAAGDGTTLLAALLKN